MHTVGYSALRYPHLLKLIGVYFTMSFRIGEVSELPATAPVNPVGIDVGVSSFVTTTADVFSTGWAGRS